MSEAKASNIHAFEIMTTAGCYSSSVFGKYHEKRPVVRDGAFVF